MKSMRSYLLLLAIAFVSMKMASAFYMDFGQTKKIAAEENKEIIMVFSGSDWCRPCILFEKEVLSQQGFKEAIRDKYLVLKLDFPSLKKNKLSAEQLKHNERLAEIYNAKGEFPKVLLLNAEGEVLKELKYKAGTGVKAFISQI